MMPLRLRSVLLSFSMLAFACPLLAAELTPDLSAEQVVVTMNRTPQGWRLALSGKFDGMAQAMRKAGEARPEAPATAS